MNAPTAPTSGEPAQPSIYYDDLAPGRVFELGEVQIDESEMVAFSRRFDPQWYHVDPERAEASEYGGLIASGWFTASLYMRTYVDGLLVRAAASASPGVEELRWLAAVYAGDTLRSRLEVIDRRPSNARPGLGTVVLEGTLTRDSDELDVLRCRYRGWFARRP
jgi:acyl dehydratase